MHFKVHRVLTHPQKMRERGRLSKRLQDSGFHWILKISRRLQKNSGRLKLPLLNKLIMSWLRQKNGNKREVQRTTVLLKNWGVLGKVFVTCLFSSIYFWRIDSKHNKAKLWLKNIQAIFLWCEYSFSRNGLRQKQFMSLWKPCYTSHCASTI